MAGEEQEIDEISLSAKLGTNPKSERKKKTKKKKENLSLEEEEEKGNEEIQKSSEGAEQEAQQDEEKQGDDSENEKKKERKRKRKKARLMRQAEEAQNRGVCYLSRIPPRMDPRTLRAIMSGYGQIDRLYLVPAGGATQSKGKKTAGKSHDQEYSEGWVEFIRKGVAKRVANMLNGEQIGGRKRSCFHYDIWNIKYLSKFKWDDLTGEIAYKSAVREQKLALELSAAKRERDFYLNKVDQSRAQTAIDERMKKKQKVKQESEAEPELPNIQPKLVRQFPQNKPVAAAAKESKPELSKGFLSGIFGGA